MKKQTVLITLSLGVLAVAGIFLVNSITYGKPKTRQPSKKKAPVVRVGSALQSRISRTLETTGELVATESAVIAAVTDGPIVFCPWREGDRAEAGQRLVEIDRGVYRAEVRAARAAVAVARAKRTDLKSGTRPEEIAKAEEAVRQVSERADFSKVDFERTAKLVERGALPGEALEKARVESVAQDTRLAAAREHLEMLRTGPTRTALAVQQAMVDEAEARLALAKAKLAECMIAAPFAGTITAVHVRPGTMALAKAPLIEITDLSSVVVRFAVPETVAASVHLGMNLEFRPDAYPGKVLDGQVSRIYPELDRRMRTRTVEARITSGAALMPGMFGRLKLNLETAEDALILPAAAVSATPAGRQAVFIVQDGKAMLKMVETGIEEGSWVQIVAGIGPGDQVVVAGGEKLKNGKTVRIWKGAKSGKGKKRKKADRATQQNGKAGDHKK